MLLQVRLRLLNQYTLKKRQASKKNDKLQILMSQTYLCLACTLRLIAHVIYVFMIEYSI